MEQNFLQRESWCCQGSGMSLELKEWMGMVFSAKEFQNLVCCNGWQQQKRLAEQDLVCGLFTPLCFSLSCVLWWTCVTSFSCNSVFRRKSPNSLQHCREMHSISNLWVLLSLLFMILSIVSFLLQTTKLLLQHHVIYVYKASEYPLPRNLRQSFKKGDLVLFLWVCVQIHSQNRLF